MESIDCQFAYIEHRIYVHQKFIRLFISDIFARRKENPGNMGGGISLLINYPGLNSSADIVFDKPLSEFSNW